MEKRNCWEVKKCGREPGGMHSKEKGVCPASTEVSLNGVNSGMNGGRACWVVEGTNCAATMGTFTWPSATNLCTCLKCEFYEIVRGEESSDYIETSQLLNVI